MGWRSVIISQHAKVSYSSRQIIVQTRDGINQIPVDDIQILLVSSLSVVITTAAIDALIRTKAKIIFTGRDGQPSCETVGYYTGTRDAEIITTQFGWSDDNKDRIWTKLVVQKINMQIQTIQLLDKNATKLKNELKKIEVGDSTNREAVVARKYFSLIFDDDFTRRNYDPINAALNYGYSIILSAVNREIVANGYLTHLGIHHHSNENNFNLGSDLMEPFRPIIDYWIANQKFKELTPDIKYALVDLLNFEIRYNDEKTILRNALTKHVANSLNYLSENIDEIQMKVEFDHEVQNNAINGHV